MKCLHIITPVKDSIASTLETIKAITESDITVPFTYTIYNDFSTDENTRLLEEASRQYHFRLVNLSDLTDHPSPNYLLVLQTAQREALAADAGLLIVESDVIVKKNTLQTLFDGALQQPQCGIAAAVTTDEQGVINYPYLHAKGRENQVYPEKKHCSFCCSLLTPALLGAFDFHQLDPSKNWYDVTISHESLRLGLRNYLFTTLPVWHRPHSSRPWKQLKYTNPLKYYWLKFTKGLDKI
ncbi:MAG: glycosyltransferase family 2 protein [Phocaeicola sp.]|uniref:glycosyltransferase family 2 protein n=1 Tax=Phocaeicola sp. TaxID=2773926 RepID=UPI0023C7A4D4|nr:glycosyltransferase family 2 protein [Phocaeicola sp.]MDE5678473.1 glycosyltransferase family 2 protein [Phocaeicola sp.]MDE6180711.1 glycosyltransferase family 2 protein [Phocaeicola sp.]